MDGRKTAKDTVKVNKEKLTILQCGLFLFSDKDVYNVI